MHFEHSLQAEVEISAKCFEIYKLHNPKASITKEGANGGVIFSC